MDNVKTRKKSGRNRLIRAIALSLFLCNIIMILTSINWVHTQSDGDGSGHLDSFLIEMNMNHGPRDHNSKPIATNTSPDMIQEQVASVPNFHTPFVVTHWNDSRTRKTPPRIYTCTGSDGNGMRESKKILASALPEFTFFYLSTTRAGEGRPKRQFPPEMLQANYTNEYDIFLSTFSLDHCNPQHFSWLLRYFNGKFALFSGESEKEHPVQVTSGERMHAFGPLLSPKPQDFPLTYMQMTWWDIFFEVLPPNAMVDSFQRPRGNKIHYMIYANSNCVGFREEAVGRLSEFGIVHCDGKCQGKTPPSGNRSNLLRTKHGINVGSWWRNIQLYSNYRFCFVMEHEENHATYITEKIIMAFSAGCVPIYYGPEAIFDVFNHKAFVFYNISDPELALEQVRSLEGNIDLYEKMMNEPIAAKGEETIQEFFSFNDTVGHGVLKRRLRETFGFTDTNFVP